MKNKKRKLRGTTLVEIVVVTTVAMTLIGALFPFLGGARRKSNRVKCLNNLGQIAKSWIGFASEEQNGDFPWMMTQRSLNAVYDNTPKGTDGSTWGRDTWWHARNIEHMWSVAGLDLGTVRTLLSPCDPGCQASNQEAMDREAAEGRGPNQGVFAGNNKVENHAQSYAVHKGSSTYNSNTILAMTKNFVGADSGGPGGRWKAEVIPTQPYDRDEDGSFDPITGGGSWGQMARMGESLYYRNDTYARNRKAHHVVYTSIPREVDWDGWDRYLCQGHADTLRHDKNGNGQFDIKDGDIMANGFIGPGVDPQATYQRAHEKLNVHGSLVMMGLDHNQGQVVLAGGSAMQANDRGFKERITEHALDLGSHLHVLEVISQPTRQVRP